MLKFGKLFDLPKYLGHMQKIWHMWCGRGLVVAFAIESGGLTNSFSVHRKLHIIVNHCVVTCCFRISQKTVARCQAVHSVSTETTAGLLVALKLAKFPKYNQKLLPTYWVKIPNSQTWKKDNFCFILIWISTDTVICAMCMKKNDRNGLETAWFSNDCISKAKLCVKLLFSLLTMLQVRCILTCNVAHSAAPLWICPWLDWGTQNPLTASV